MSGGGRVTQNIMFVRKVIFSTFIYPAALLVFLFPHLINLPLLFDEQKIVK